MSVSGVSNTPSNSNAAELARAKQNKGDIKTEKEKVTTEDKAVVYEKSDSSDTKKVYVRDEATINRLKAEMDVRTQNIKDLVERMLLKQGKVITEASDVYDYLREGNFEVDPETRAQAQRDIAEDGYWGVEQTSERLVSFAIAVAGGDPSKADLMINAVKKGFEEAEKAWGGKLPDISYKTFEAVTKKLEAWRDGIKDQA